MTLSKRVAEMAVHKATVARMANSNPQLHRHTSSLAFRHHPPHSARISYANEGPLSVSAQLPPTCQRLPRGVGTKTVESL